LISHPNVLDPAGCALCFSPKASSVSFMPELENPFPEAGHRRSGRSRVASLALGGAGLALALALGSLAALLSSRQDVAALQETVTRLEQQISAVASDVASTGNRITSLESSGSSQIGGDAATSIVATDLPRYPQNGQDTAVGLKLSSLTGVHYYDGQTRSFDPADGKARAWLVWAHWCPYCQQELPVVADWHESRSAEYPNLELVSITTGMDDTAANPLVPYLEANQFTFPVLMDESGVLTRQLGVNAFPFWVFTGPDGTVVGRTAGLLPEEQLLSIFDQLEQLGAEA
jgi:thiol-disulfide isomerase/thioredoxin